MRRRRTDQQVSTALWLLVVFIAALMAAGATSLFIITRQDVTNLTSEAQDAGTDINTLRNQVLELGGDPKVPAVAPERGEDGTAGTDGRDGRDGSDGLTVIGPAGADGKDGVDGKDGRDGVSVVGPQGQVGPQGAQGPAGPAGADGRGPVVFSFVAGGVLYTCTDPSGDGAYECTQVAQ